MDDQVIKLVLNVDPSGKVSVQQLADATDSLKSKLASVPAAMDRADKATVDLTGAVRALERDLASAQALIGKEAYALAQAGESTEDAARNYYELASANHVATDATRAFDAALEKALEQTRASQAISRALAEDGMVPLDVATKKATQSSTAGARAFLDLGRAAQDLAQGGLPAIINNLEGLGYNLTSAVKEGASFKAMLASPAGIAGALTLVSTLIYVLGPKVAEFFASFGDGAEKVKLNTGALEALKEELSDVEEKIDKYKDATSLSNAELAKANDLLARRAELEAKVAEETERRKRAEQLGALKSPEQEKQEKAQEEVLKALHGQQAQLVEGVTGSLGTAKRDALSRERAEIERQIEENRREQTLTTSEAGLQGLIQEAESLRKRLAQNEARINAEQVERRARATDVVARAFGGDKGALDALKQAVGANPQGFTPFQRTVISEPERLRDFGKFVGKIDAFIDSVKHDVGIRSILLQKTFENVQTLFKNQMAENRKSAAQAERDRRQAEQDRAKAEREAERAAQEAERAAQERQRGANEASAHIQAQAAARAGSIGATTPLDELAAQAAARMRSNGISDPVEMIARLRHMLAPDLQRMGAGPEVASVMAKQAVDAVNESVITKQQQLMGQGVNAQAAAQAAMIDTFQQFSREVALATAASGHAVMALHMMKQQSMVRTQSQQRRGQVH